jgi:hypothetical protein
MRLIEWFVSFSIAPHDRCLFDAVDAEAVWRLIIEWAEGRHLGIGGSYRADGDGFLYEFGVCATEADQLIDEDEMRELLRAVSAALSDRAVASGAFRPFTDDESDPSRLERILEMLRKLIN